MGKQSSKATNGIMEKVGQDNDTILREALSKSKLKEKDFFFQAEDGIRDTSVTGVQTCALPISPRCSPRPAAHGRSDPPRVRGLHHHRVPRAPRSEERRVGKECRFCRWTSPIQIDIVEG